MTMGADCLAFVIAAAPDHALVRTALGPLGCRPSLHPSVTAAAADAQAAQAALILVEDDASDAEHRTLREVRAVPTFAAVPTILICAGGEPHALRRTGMARGANDVIVRPHDDALALQMRAAPHLALARLRGEAGHRMRAMAEEARQALAEAAAREREIIRRLMLAAEFRDDHAGDHLARVAGCVIAIADGLGLSEAEANDLALASTMHDVGKIGVADSVLLKAGPLTPAERDEMMQHAVRGYRMLHDSPSRLLQLAAEIALSHHERWDGAGYPRGLAGTRIPLSGRITAVADVFDALISARPYKAGWSLERARAYVEAQAGSHFDPDCVAAFLSRWADIAALIADREADAQAA